VLSLLAESPRHGYDIIKALEERSGGFYSPSPGVIYPTLTYLEEAGHVVSEAAGNKKVYSITENGTAFLNENRLEADAILGRIAWMANRLRRARRHFETEETETEESHSGHAESVIEAARRTLDEAVAAKEADASPEEQRRIVDVLLRAARDVSADS